MKYPQLVSMPSAVSDWLEEQLEARGIESEVYARYILSLLHAHHLDLVYPEDDFSLEHFKKSCEIESLVDELCEKLKHVNSDGDNNSASQKIDENLSVTVVTNKTVKKESTKELAERYYAAFPALGNAKNSFFSSNINLVSGKWPSSSDNKSGLNLLATKWTQSEPIRRPKRKNVLKKPGGNMLKSLGGQSHSNKKIQLRNMTEEAAENVENWKMAYNNNSQCNSDSPKSCFSKCGVRRDIDRGLEDCSFKLWISSDTKTQQGPASVQHKSPIEHSPPNPQTALSSTNKERPTEIWESCVNYLFDESSSSEINESSSEEEETAIKNEYLREKNSDHTVNNNEKEFDGFIDFWNEYSPSLEEFYERAKLAEELMKFQDEEFMKYKLTNNTVPEADDDKTKSLSMINHSQDNSAFCVYRRPRIGFDLSASPVKHPLTKKPLYPLPPKLSEEPTLLTSPFKPLKIGIPGEDLLHDGATFNIKSSPNDVNYQRSATGSLFVETEFGEYRKYFKYRENYDYKLFDEQQFQVKFCVSDNDKSCQTTDDLLLMECREKFNTIIAPDLKNVKITKATKCTFDSVEESEFDWNHELKKCDFCDRSRLKSLNVKEIWKSVEVDRAWGPITCSTPQTEITDKLREESIEEGEKLLLDLNNFLLEETTSPIVVEDAKRRICSDFWNFSDGLGKVYDQNGRRSVTL